MTLTRHVYIDFGRDGTYSHASADVTAYVESAAWQYGMNGAFEEVAQASRLYLTLRNDTGGWWQDASGGTFYGLLRPGLLVKLVYTSGGTDYTRFIGRVLPPVQYDANQFGEQRRVYITAGDPFDMLAVQEYAPRLEADVRVDTEIETVLAGGVLAVPYHEDVWVLGASQLGVNTKLPDNSSAYALDTANTTLPHTGVDAGTSAGVSALGYLQELIAAEMGGRLFYDAPTGKIVFHRRQRDWLNRTSTRTLNNDDLLGASVGWGGGLVNHVTVNYALTEEGAAASVLWEATNLPMYVGPDSPKEFRIQFRDPDNEAVRVAALDVLPMVRDLDFAGNENADGSGEGITDKLSASVTPDANGATVRISNGHSRGGYVTTLQVRGTPLKALDGQQAEGANATSISANGLYPMVLTVPLIDSEVTAQSYADWLAVRYGDATTRFENVSISSETNATTLAALMSAGVGDRITVEETWSDHDADYFVLGGSYQDNGFELYGSLTLTPANIKEVWILGTSQIGVDTVLAY